MARRTVTFADLVSSKVVEMRDLAEKAGISAGHLSNLCAGRYTGVSRRVFSGLMVALDVDEWTLEKALEASRRKLERADK